MPSGTLNFNIGVLGHVDSGKTSLCKALSTTASTAAFDKNPQSKERGITLDLGFSSFTVDVPEGRKEEFGDCDNVQYTLVDCPGHASLIRTIIGGAQIIDLMLLVVDVVKGMQTQTAECLVIGQITCQSMVVVLNKTDLLPPDKRQATVEKMKKRMWKTLESTQFKDCPIVAVAAKPGGPEAGDTRAEGVEDLIAELQKQTYLPRRNPEGPFIFSVDHCFSLRGQGTVLTGTAISGSIAINDTVEIPSMKMQKKVKSMQMFRKPVEKIIQGDRAGMCVTQFDPKLLERGLVCQPGVLSTVHAFIGTVHKIAYFKGSVSTKAKFHITVGHETVMGNIFLFGLPPSSSSSSSSLPTPSTPSSSSASSANNGGSSDDVSLDFSQEYAYQEELFADSDLSGVKSCAGSSEGEGGSGGWESPPLKQFVLVELEKAVTCSRHALMIGSKLDTDIHANACRLAFHGRITELLEDTKYRETVLPRLKVFKMKSREGLVERVTDAYSVIGKNLFKKETNIQAFANLKVTLTSGQQGVIEGGFGQSGKVKVRVPEGLPPEVVQRFSGGGKRKGKKGGGAEAEEEPMETQQGATEPVKIVLTFKRYVFDPHKKMIQT
ncbi:selenocysteine-specific elongation factor-like [Babylonia areolata]|uniref:selenocysteine-specific elongation factor-like n=1 Tax=Babylonia areolata TaxID=304850 RepID=UPI003FD1785C